MARMILSRLAQTVPVLLGVTLIAFVAIRLLPGDPARAMLGPRATPAALAQMRENLGLDRPLPAQYARFLGGLLRGELGESLVFRRPVLSLIVERLPPTLGLLACAAALAALICVPQATLAALRRGSWLDRLLHGGLLFAFAMPSFWVAAVLVQGFGVRLRWLPISGWGDGPLAQLRHLILPALTVALALAAPITRALRASVLEHLEADYVRTARAKGLAGRAVLLRHVLRLALIPAATLLGLQIGLLLGGAVIVESIFALPGLGQLLLAAILARDYPVVQGLTLLLTLWAMLATLATDLIVIALDPRAHAR